MAEILKKKYLDSDGLVVVVNNVKAADAKVKTEAIDASKITIDTATTTEGYAKSYSIKQNGTAVATIDIPKDMVVSSGKVVTNPEGQTEGTYIELTLANATNDKIYINVGTLVDIYVAEADATQIQLAIDATTREISATIVAGSIGTTELADKAVTNAKIADGAVGKSKVDAEITTSLGKANSAVQTVTSGTVNGTVAVDGTDVSVKGLASAAYAEATAFDAAGTAETKVGELASGAVATNTGDITTLKTKVNTLETNAIEAITVEEIDSLFDATE